MAQKVLISVGSALLASKVAQTLSHITMDDVLGSVGLSRRSNRALESIALVGVGAFLGAGAALLLAPMNGEETRERIAEGFAKAGERGKELAQKAKDKAPELIEEAKAKVHEGFGSATRQQRYES